MLKAIRDLNGHALVEYGEEDNLHIDLFEYGFSFSMTEIKVKRRSLISNPSQENRTKDFRSMYEGVFSGRLVIKFEEIINHWNKGKTPSFSLEFEDSIDAPLETQLGDIFKALYKVANNNKIANFIIERDNDKKEKERNRLLEIEEENRRQLKLIE